MEAKFYSSIMALTGISPPRVRRHLTLPNPNRRHLFGHYLKLIKKNILHVYIRHNNRSRSHRQRRPEAQSIITRACTNVIDNENNITSFPIQSKTKEFNQSPSPTVSPGVIPSHQPEDTSTVLYTFVIYDFDTN